VDSFAAHGDLKFAERETRRHRHTPPHHRVIPVSQTLTCRIAVASAASVERLSSGRGALRPSFHLARLAPAVPLVLGTPQKVMLSSSEHLVLLALCPVASSRTNR
jgi:hypothetical protein